MAQPRLFLSLFFSIFLFSFFASSAQTITKVTGRVYDPLTNEPIPFASVVFKNTTSGITAIKNIVINLNVSRYDK